MADAEYNAQQRCMEQRRKLFLYMQAKDGDPNVYTHTELIELEMEEWSISTILHICIRERFILVF